jgi:hypothetical protein
MSKDFLKVGEITNDVISKWKEQHGKVVKYTTDDKKHTAFFKKPDVSAIEASTVIASTKPVQSNKVLAKACFLGGDVEVYEQTEYLLGLGKQLQKLVDVVEGELEEL